MPQNVGSIVADVVDCSRLQQQHRILQQKIENRFNNISLMLEGKPPNWTVNGSNGKSLGESFIAQNANQPFSGPCSAAKRWAINDVIDGVLALVPGVEVKAQTYSLQRRSVWPGHARCHWLSPIL